MQRLLTAAIYVAVFLVMLPMLPFMWMGHHAHDILNETKS